MSQQRAGVTSGTLVLVPMGGVPTGSGRLRPVGQKTHTASFAGYNNNAGLLDLSLVTWLDKSSMACHVMGGRETSRGASTTLRSGSHATFRGQRFRMQALDEVVEERRGARPCNVKRQD